jgi:ferredoxin-NADP reductase
MTDAPAAAHWPARWQPTVITAVSALTERVKSFRFRPSQPFSHRAGQHVDVRLTAPDGYRAQRSYSIASAPEAGDEIELAIERLENGEVSPFFHEVAAVGDEIEMKGPLGGHFVWSAGEPGPVVLIGGGSGVVPLASMARHRAASGSKVPAALLYSSRIWDEVIFRDELLGLDARGDGFDLTLTLTREPARRDKDFSRRIDPAMISAVLGKLPDRPALAYVCGANAFVTAAADALIAAGVRAERIKTERYGV